MNYALVEKYKSYLGFAEAGIKFNYGAFKITVHGRTMYHCITNYLHTYMLYRETSSPKA